MSTTAFALRNYRFIIVLTAAALSLGVLGFATMPRQEDPSLPAFGGRVTVIYPSASPEEIEDRVLEPIEEAINELVEIETIESIASDGVATVVAEFRDDVDKNRAYDLLVQRVGEASPLLPDEVMEVEVREIKPNNAVMMQAMLFSEQADTRALRRWAEELEARWRVLADAKQVNLEGVQQQQVHVLVDPERLAAAGLSLGQVMRAIAAANGDLPGGVVQAGTERLTIRTNLRFQTLQDVRNTVLSSVDGRPVQLSDLAEVVWGDEDPSYLVRHQGKPAAMVTLTLKDGRNVFRLASQARGVLEEFRQSLPQDIGLVLALDQSADVSQRLGRFGRSLLQGALIISVFVALLVGWRPAIVIVAAMLLSVGISFWLLDARGIALQQMSIAGLVVVLGLLVDNAIVVVEGILQQRHAGATSSEAAVLGTDRVASAVASSTGTTIAAFVPMLFMAGSVGDFTRDIPSVVVLVLIVSLAVSLLVTPLIAARVLRADAVAHGTPASRWLQRQANEGFYARVLARALDAPKRAIGLLLVGAVGTLALAPLVGMNFFPRAEDKPQFLVRVKMPQGSSLANTDRNAREVEDHLLAQDWVAGVTTNVGKGNPMIYYNLIRSAEARHLAELLVKVPREVSPRIPELARSLREHFSQHPELELETKLLVQGPPVGLPVSIRLYGPDLSRLREHADAVARQLRQIEGAINVTHELRPGPARLDLQADPVKLGKLGLDSAFLAQEVRLAMAGGTATVLRRGDEDYDVVVRVAPEGNERMGDLSRLRVPLTRGQAVPLSQLTQPVLTPTFAQIEHTDLERSVIVGSDVDGRLAADIVADLLPFVEGLEFAPQERFEVIGEDEERDRAFVSMLRNVLVAVGLIYGILVLQFRSFALPLIIFTSIPVALAGSVLGLFLGGWPFGFTAFIGLLALVGIVVNDAIVLVDQVNHLRREGAGLIDALKTGTASRMQPILLTTLTTIAGLLPLTLAGGSMWGPMGWVIIGGLIAATMVTLLMVPSLYLLFERGRDASTASDEDSRPSSLSGALATPASIVIAVGLALPLASVAHGQDILEPLEVWASAESVPLDLEAVVRRVPEANVEASALWAGVDEVEAGWREAKAQRWPALSLSADYVRTNDPGQTFGLSLTGIQDPMELLNFDSDRTADLLRARAGVSWVLWDRSRGFAIAAARALRDSQEQGTRAAVRQLQLAAIAQYFLIVQLTEEVEVQRAARAAVEQELSDARVRQDAGRGLRSDVLGLEARGAEIDAVLAGATAALEQSRGRLAELLALPDGSSPLVDGRSIVSEVRFENFEQLLARALADRPELRGADAQLSGANASVSQQGGARLPQLVASASLDYLMPERDSQRDDQSYTALLGVRWSPFQGGAIGARVDRAKAARRRAEHALEQVRLRVRQQALDAWTRIHESRQRVRAADLQLEAAQEAYRIVSLRFREGRSTLSRFLDAEAALTSARTATVRSQALLQVARAQLRWVSGDEFLP